MHAEDDFDPLTPPRKLRPAPEEPLPTEPPEYEPVHITPATRPATIGRTMPYSPEAEEYLLSCCMLDGAEVIQKCVDAQISGDSFYDAKSGIVFNCLLDLHRRKLPTEAANVAEELKRTRQLDQVGGIPFLAQVSARIPTTAQAGYFIKTVREYALRREIIRVSTAVVEDAFTSADALDVAEKCERRLTEVLKRGQQSTDLVPMPHASLAYPDSADPDILLGQDDYLGRGGGLLFVSHGGAGKSSLIYDAACLWCLGQSFAGIRANGRLRTLMIQAEDSERYMGKLRTSFDHANNLQPMDIAYRDENVIIYHARGITGAPFFALLRRLVEKHAPDLVVINPVYLYAEGDISSPDACQPFLVGLDAINRDQRFAYILVHHTGKPVKKDGKNQRAELEDWETIYQGFGSSFFANWPRCTMLLEPRGKERGNYWLRLGKAGINAGVTKLVEHGGSKRHEPTTKIAMRHSAETMMVGGVKRPVIYWEADEAATNADEPKKESAKPEKKRYNLSDVIACFPNDEATALYAPVIARAVNGRVGISKDEFLALRVELEASGAIKQTADGKLYKASVST